MTEINPDWTLDFGLWTDKTSPNDGECKSFEFIVHRLLSEVQFLGKGK
jgi:hypothetical protein